MESRVPETVEEVQRAVDWREGGKEETRVHQRLNRKGLLGCKHRLTKKLTDLTKYVRPNTSVIYRSIEEDLEKIKKGENRLRASFEGTSIAYNQKNQEYL